MMKTLFALALAICWNFTARADVFLRSGESIFLGGQRVYCEAGGGGGGGSFRRNFRCEPVDPNYTSLESDLRVTSLYADGRRETNSLTQLHYRSDCDALATLLAQRCGAQGQCTLQYCEADDPNYRSLLSTMYNIVFDWSNRASVTPVDHFNFMQDCRNAL